MSNDLPSSLWSFLRRRGAPHAGQRIRLNGKTAIVTGATSGIGFWTAIQLASQGANVILACRSRKRTQDAIERMRQECPKGSFEFVHLDLMDLDSCVRAAKELKSRPTRYHILINNAGIMWGSFTKSQQGIESQFATNHLGHFVFTQILLPSIVTGGRIVNVSSEGHRMAYDEGILPYAALNSEKRYSQFAAYGQSKLANILYTRGLDRRTRRKLYVNAAHPGAVKSELHRTVPGWLQPLLDSIMYFTHLEPTPDQGSYTQLWLATSPDIVDKDMSGLYFVPMGHQAVPSAQALNDDLVDRLWAMSMAMIQEKLGPAIVAEIQEGLSR